MSRCGLLVVAGEASGDEHAAAVIRRLGSRPGEVWGMGGAALRSAGVELVIDLRETTGLGAVEILGRLPKLAGAFSTLLREARRRRPRAALLVDSPDFNMPLGRRLRELGVPVLGYVAPQFWAWRYGRVRSVGRSFDRLACLLPFEVAPLRAQGADARFVGHPAAEEEPIARAEARARLELDQGRRCLALLPGSRPAELRGLLEPMILAADRSARALGGLEVLLPLAPSVELHRRLPGWIRVISGAEVRGAGRLVLAAADAALVTSGTATLEAALAGTPQAAFYRLSPLSLALGRCLVRSRFFAMPNVVLRRPIVPELVGSSVDVMSFWATELLSGRSGVAEEQRAASAALRGALIGPGASGAVAGLVGELLER